MGMELDQKTPRVGYACKSLHPEDPEIRYIGLHTNFRIYETLMFNIPVSWK